MIWGHSSIGRAIALQAIGCRFDPGWLHQTASIGSNPIIEFRLGMV